MNPRPKFFARLARKAGAAALILGLGWAAADVWLFLHDRADFDARRSAQIAELTAARKQLDEELADNRAKLTSLQAGAKTEQQRAGQAATVIAALQDLNGWWNRIFGDRAQARRDAERIAHLKQLRADSLEKSAELTGEARRTQWTLDGLEIALAGNEHALRQAEADQSRVRHYLTAAWAVGKGWVFAALALYFLGPALFKFFLYFGFAPLAARGRPVRLRQTMEAFPRVEECGAAVEVALWPGEILWLRKAFLPASTEGLQSRTRWVLDWRIPFASLACGWVKFAELRNAQAGAGRAASIVSRRVPATTWLTAVSVPENASLVVRPGLLAGVLRPGGQRLVVRRHWRIFHRLSWVAGQFRHFEFAGPCRLLLATESGVQAVPADGREATAASVQRANLSRLAGFTPNLDWRVVRSESFRTYFRGRNPLFVGVFEGSGRVLCTESAPVGPGRAVHRSLGRIRRRMEKLFGL